MPRGAPLNVETLHPMEISHVSRVFSFRAMQNFHEARSFHAIRDHKGRPVT
jgi:hypothetical protein